MNPFARVGEAGITRSEIYEKWANLVRLGEGLQKAFVDFLINADSKEGPTDERVVRDNTEWEDSTAMSSLITRGPDKGKHILMLDLDIRHAYVPSTTPGHGHLIIYKPMTQETMLRLLDRLGELDIIEPGFASSARHRGAAWLRLPWIKKLWGPSDPEPIALEAPSE